MKPARYAATFAGVALVYFAAAKLGLSFAFATRQVTAIWPPSGVAFVAFALLGRRAWPAIFLGAFVANATHAEPPLTAAGIAVGNTLAGLVGVYAARRAAAFHASLDRVRDVLGLALGAAAGSIVSASNGVVNLGVAGIVPWSDVASVWRVWWIGDSLGVLLIAPLFFTWIASYRIDLRPLRVVELLALVAGVVIVGRLVFLGPPALETHEARRAYMAFPFLVWAGLRFGPRETATTAVALTALAVWGVIHDRGPFAVGTLDARLVTLDMFLAVVGGTALLVGAVTSERRLAFDQLKTLNAELEERVRARTMELSATLAEREVLLQEIHHRVKNNLQVISSLINMQVRKLDDAASKDALEEMQTRVQAIALIHEKLYQSHDYTRVAFSDYARSLATSAFHASASSSNVRLELAIEDVALAVDKAIPCGLVLNELVTNAIKHAFPGDRSGTIRVELARVDGDRLRLAVKDDGIGLPAGEAARAGASSSIGMKLVATLADQLDGTLAVTSNGGAMIEVSFPIER